MARSARAARKQFRSAKRAGIQSGLRRAAIARVMKLAPTRCKPGSARRAGFTLAEVLAALLFMAIVIPVALQGIKIANQAGQVAVRKTQAARVAQRVLNESIVTTNWDKSGLSGTVTEDRKSVV